MARRSGWRASADARSKLWHAQNRPPEGESWVWLTQDMLESPAWNALSHAALMVVFRLVIEHLAHGGAENGRLLVTFDQFEAFGIRRRSIAPALREARALGWIEVTHLGRGGNADHRKASNYALAWLPKAGGQGANGESLTGTLSDKPWKLVTDAAHARRLVEEAEHTVTAAKRPSP